MIGVGCILVASAISGRYERKLTTEERSTCAKEIANLEKFNVPWKIAKTRGGFSLAVYGANDGVSGEILNHGQWEGAIAMDTYIHAKDKIASFPRTCKDPTGCHSHSVIDVGANLGWWSFSAASLGMNSVAVEGAPTNLAFLALSKCLNPTLATKIRIMPTLVGEGTQSCVLAMPSQNVGDGALHCKMLDQNSWTNDEIDGLLVASKGYLKTAYRTQIRKLDDVVKEAWEADPKLPDYVTLLKMDIEGSEFRAFNGSRNLFASKKVPTFFTEIWKIVSGGPAEYIQAIKSAGYVVKDATCSNNPIESPAKFVEIMGAIHNLV